MTKISVEALKPNFVLLVINIYCCSFLVAPNLLNSSAEKLKNL